MFETLIFIFNCSTINFTYFYQLRIWLILQFLQLTTSALQYCIWNPRLVEKHTQGKKSAIN